MFKLKDFADHCTANQYPETKQWIDTTRKLIARHNAKVLEQADTRMHYETLGEIMSIFEKAAPIDWNTDVQAALSKIIASALELFQVLHKQAAIFQVAMLCATGADGNPSPFKPSWMEDIGNEMEDGGKNWSVGIVLFPVILKWGDERGENVRPSWKPRMLCSEDC